MMEIHPNGQASVDLWCHSAAAEVAVGLAYSALLYYDAGLAREVVAIENEMDEMRYRLERWILLAVRHIEDASRLRGMGELDLTPKQWRWCEDEAAGWLERARATLLESEGPHHPRIAEVAAGLPEDLVDAPAPRAAVSWYATDHAAVRDLAARRLAG